MYDLQRYGGRKNYTENKPKILGHFKLPLFAKRLFDEISSFFVIFMSRCSKAKISKN